MDGQTLIVSSCDGFCSIITFDDLELGTPYPHALATLPPPNGLPVPSTSASTVKAGLTAYFTPAVDKPKLARSTSPIVSTSTGSSSKGRGVATTSEKGKGKAAETIVIADSSSPAKRTTEGGEPVKKKPKRAVLTSMGPSGGPLPPAPAPAP